MGEIEESTFFIYFKPLSLDKYPKHIIRKNEYTFFSFILHIHR